MESYVVVIEKTATGYGAHVPDLPGCIAAAETLEVAKRLIAEAVEYHLQGMAEAGEPIPEPTTVTTMVEVRAA